MVSSALLPLAFVATIYPSTAFHLGRSSNLVRISNAGPLRAADNDESINSTESPLDPNIAAQFTIQVCTSTSCTRKLKDQGLDQYTVLGDIYAMAQSANMEECMIIEDGGCQGGKNCKMGPCVAILHEDFMGNVALEGMNSEEMQQSVFHNVLTNDDAERVWGCMENAITMMAEEENESETQS